jgi:hypothetical protein
MQSHFTSRGLADKETPRGVLTTFLARNGGEQAALVSQGEPFRLAGGRVQRRR